MYALCGGSAVFFAELLILCEESYRLCQSLWRRRRYGKSCFAVETYVGDSRGERCVDDGLSVDHSFKLYYAECFAWSYRREHEDIAVGVSLTELLIGEKSQKMYLVLHAVSGGVAFQSVAQIACACDEKLTALYLCKGAEKHVNALVIDKSACEEHLDAVLVGCSFGEHGTALYGEVLLGYDTIGENSALVFSR